MTRAFALKHFKKVDPKFHAATKAHHASLPEVLPGRTTKAALFESLASTVVSQQLGLAAAKSIFARVKTAVGGKVTSDALLKVRIPKLRGAGLSGAKSKTLKEIAKAVKTGKLDLMALKKISEADATERLIQIWGLGPWSAEMFLMFSVGRPDIFSAGDLGLARGMEQIFGLPKNTDREKLNKIAEKWAPFRTYASLLLWETRDAKK